MKVQAKTIQVLQIELGKKFDTRDEKLEFLSQFVGCDLSTSKDLTEYQAMDAIQFLKTGKQPDNASWASFDKNNKQHRTILSRCITYGWKELKGNILIADRASLGTWLKSFRSPVNKPLLEMKSEELNTVINALNFMINDKYGKV
jgi:hypothetical protein